MKRMHALFAILAMSLVALIARPAGAYVPKGRLFNTLRTERDGSPIVEIGENCKLKQIMDGYGPMYKQATGAELTFRVIRAANPEHTIPVCLVKGDGAMKISRASEKVWENCPADQQSIYLIAGRNDAIRIPMGEQPAAEPAPSVEPVQPAAESPEQIQSRKDAACFRDDTCLLDEAKRRDLLPTVQPAPAQTVERLLRAEKASEPTPAVSPSVTTTTEKSDAPFWGAFVAFIIAGICAITFFFKWRSAVSAKVRALQLMQESKQLRLQENKQELESAQAEAKEAWKQWDAVKGELRTANETLKTFEDEKPAQEALRTAMLRIAREDCRLGDVPENATIRDLFWRIKNYYVEQVQDLGLRNVFSAPDDLRTMLMNIAVNKRHLSIPASAQPKDIMIQIDRSYESELREQRKQLTDEQDKVKDLGTKMADMKGKLDTLAEKHRQATADLQEAQALTDAAIQNRDAAERSERALKAAIREYAMVLQSSSMYERRLIEIRKKTEENSELLVELKRQHGEYEAQGNQELMETSERSIKEVNDRLSKLLMDKEDVQERGSIKRQEIVEIEAKLGFSFSNEAISSEAGEYRAEAMQHLASASATRELMEVKAEQLQRDLETERAKLKDLEALKTDLEGRLAAKEKQLELREGAVQSLFAEVLKFCDMDPEADVERIHAAGGPAFLMDQLRIRMTMDLTEENERFQKDLATANRLVEERNAEILDLCKEMDALRAQVSNTDGEKPKEPSESGVQIRVPSPEDLLQHGLSNDPRKAFDFALALIAALPPGSAFRIASTDDLIRLDKLQQLPIEFPNDPRVLFRKAKLRDHDCGTALSLFKTYFPEPKLKHVPRYLELYSQYLKGFEPEQRRHTMLGIPAQAVGSSIAPTLIPTRPPGTGTGNET